jgi:hypothetical protein
MVLPGRIRQARRPVHAVGRGGWLEDERDAGDGCANGGACQHVTGIVQLEHHAGERDQESEGAEHESPLRIVRDRYGGEGHRVQSVSSREADLIEPTGVADGAGLNTACLLTLHDIAQHHLEIVEHVVPVDTLGACTRLPAQ